jgi:protein-tyrosine phosphatase
MEPYYDPTKVRLVRDPLVERFSGVAYHGDTPFDVPFISEILEGTLYMGGCIGGLPLPERIVNVVSLYAAESYVAAHDVRSVLTVRMIDSAAQAMGQVLAIAAWVNACRAEGPTLVHCQAGLNRSALVTATALVLSGDYTPAEAIALLREKRSPAVLCNGTFERFVLGLEGSQT